MPDEVSDFIIKHGYLAICILIFIQEIGIPNPVPNEIVLLFAGYLSFTHLLSLPIVLLLTIFSDFFATAILFSIFYFFGKCIIENKPRWFPLSVTRIKILEKKVLDKGKTFIFIGRMTPFIRGYVTAISGLLNISPKVFFPITIFSTTAWCSICIISGFLLGSSWSVVAKNLGFNHVIIFILSAIAISVIIHLIKGNKD